jgi:peroxiredoxin
VELPVSRRALAILIAVTSLGLAMLAVFRGRMTWVAPDFALQDLAGNTLRLSHFRGKVVVINVWTTWCEPCRVEMPSMQLLYRRLRDEGLVMLAVSADADGREAVEAFVQKLGLTFTILLDPDGVVPSRYGTTGYPETFIVDREGRVVAHEVGPRDWSEARFERALRGLMESGTYDSPS